MRRPICFNRQESDRLEFKRHIYLLKTDSDQIKPYVAASTGVDNFEKAQNSLLEYDRLLRPSGLLSQFTSTDREVAARSGRELERKLKGSDLQNFLILP